MNHKWAIIGCGHIAGEMAEAIKENGGSFYAVYSRTYEKAMAFAEKYNIPRVYKSADELLADKETDIVYIATPHNSHIEYLRKALAAGKHVLCEKAITLNSAELMEAVALAEKNNLILAEAMTLFHCPVYRQLDSIIASGKLGRIKTIMVNLDTCKEYDMTSRFFSLSLAGGAMLDVGVYALSFARYFLTECPDDVMSQMTKASTGADEQVNIILKNGKNEMATINLSLVARLPKMGFAAFENGYISVDNYNRTKQIDITYNDGTTETLVDRGALSSLASEAEDMEKAVEGKENLMHLDYTIDIMNIMTKVRYDHKMMYPEEM